MRMESRIRDKLTAAFAPSRLEVINESHFHAGHAGANASGETHFRVAIIAPAFTGKSRLERHRMVNAVLTSELAEGVHALAIKAAAPDESGP